jgi:hypothetical protein
MEKRMQKKKIKLKRGTQDILNDYAFEISGKIKIFCPNCFCLRSETSARKHFGNCSFVIKGKDLFENSKIKILRACNDDTYFVSFLKRIRKMLLYSVESMQLDWNNKYDHWILYRKTSKWKFFPAGLITISYSSELNSFVVLEVVSFPKIEKKDALDNLFMNEVCRYYENRGGILKPNDC